MDKAYDRIIWQNQPSTSTALGATNLNKMDVAINTIDDRVVGMDTSKANQSTVNTVVQSITYNESTGVLTITKVNGTSTTIDTKLEKLAVNFVYNPETQQLDITLDDGTVQHVDMSALVTQYEFEDTDTVSFSVETDGTIKANIILGSITGDYLQPDYLADIIVQANISVTNAQLSKRYAVGGVVPEDAEDNAKYYKERAEEAAAEAEEIAGFNPLEYYKKTEIDATVGDRSLLPTPNSSLVNSINELDNNKVNKGESGINVKDYGAIGNGSTNDTLAFQNALLALPSGGKFLIPTGTYLIEDTLYIPSNVHIKANGLVVLKRNSDTNAIMLTKSTGATGGYGACTNILVENIIFDASQSDFQPNCTLFGSGHANNIRLKGCTFRNLDGWHMVEFNATRDSLIEDCTFDTYGYGNAGATVSEMVQLDYASSAGFPWYGPYDNTSCKNITIQNNVFKNCKGAGIGNHSFATGVILQDIKIKGNVFETIEKEGITLSDIAGLKINKNSFNNVFYGIKIIPQQNDSFSILINDNTYEGLRLTTASGPDSRFIGVNPTNVTTNGITDVKIINNTISNSLRHAIGITANVVVIDGNYISGSNNNGIYFYGGSRAVISNNNIVYNNITASGGGDLVIGYNTAKAANELIVQGNRIQVLIVGTNVTASTTLIQNNVLDTLSSSPSATVKNNIINGTWTAG
jgi:hypothetical protein